MVQDRLGRFGKAYLITLYVFVCVLLPLAAIGFGGLIVLMGVSFLMRHDPAQNHWAFFGGGLAILGGGALLMVYCGRRAMRTISEFTFDAASLSYRTLGARQPITRPCSEIAKVRYRRGGGAMDWADLIFTDGRWAVLPCNLFHHGPWLQQELRNQAARTASQRI